MRPAEPEDGRLSATKSLTAAEGSASSSCSTVASMTAAYVGDPFSRQSLACSLPAAFSSAFCPRPETTVG